VTNQKHKKGAGKQDSRLSWVGWALTFLPLLYRFLCPHSRLFPLFIFYIEQTLAPYALLAKVLRVACTYAAHKRSPTLPLCNILPVFLQRPRLPKLQPPGRLPISNTIRCSYNIRYKMDMRTSLRIGRIHARVPALRARSSAFVAASREGMQGGPFPDAGIAVQLAAPLAHRSDVSVQRILSEAL
jgi:hypothetical protein